MQINVAVFFGCCSVEHEVSIISAVQAMHSFDREKYNLIPVYVTKDGVMMTGEELFDIENYKNLPALLKKLRAVTLVREGKEVLMKSFGMFGKATRIDVAFPIVHGTNCEDGTIQGLFEFLRLPYVGCDIISSAVGMDKAVFKDVLAAAGLPVLPCVRFYSREYFEDREALLEKIEKEIGLPAIVKPANLGSSVGISKAATRAELESAIDLACSFADKILVERAIMGLREINCSVLGDYDDCIASCCEEPIAHDAILSFEDKYLSGGSKKNGASKGMQSLSRIIPAQISEEKTEEIRTLACKVIKAIGGAGIARIDFMLDTADGDKVYVNEINTIPGSLAFYLWEKTDINYKDLLSRAVDLAFKRSRKQNSLNFTFESNILSGVSLGGTKGSKGSKM
ncbi:MAG: D-alanine--D-alanine ligase [Clostridia bacterium]|nr:D-alanine--D-alanine ligase [Oscillospiraceae bacterium]MBR6694630.1 D-alanine--D-alanine ligase [Clostridia bacterium]